MVVTFFFSAPWPFVLSYPFNSGLPASQCSHSSSSWNVYKIQLDLFFSSLVSRAKKRELIMSLVSVWGDSIGLQYCFRVTLRY